MTLKWLNYFSVPILLLKLVTTYTNRVKRLGPVEFAIMVLSHSPDEVGHRFYIEVPMEIRITNLPISVKYFPVELILKPLNEDNVANSGIPT